MGYLTGRYPQPEAKGQNRWYICPDCDGAGSWESSPSGWANDPSSTSHDCSECDGHGEILMDRHEAAARELTRSTTSDAPHNARDLFSRVAWLRKHQRSGAYYQQRYGELLQRAVSPVFLP